MKKHPETFLCINCDFCFWGIDSEFYFDYNNRLYAIKLLEREQFNGAAFTAAKRGDFHAGK